MRWRDEGHDTCYPDENFTLINMKATENCQAHKYVFVDMERMSFEYFPAETVHQVYHEMVLYGKCSNTESKI